MAADGEPEDSASILRQIQQRIQKHRDLQDLHFSRFRILDRLRQTHQELISQGKMTAVQSEQLLASVEAMFPPPTEPSAEEREIASVFEQFKQRQASRVPDLADLYERKRQLDAARDNDVRPAD